MPRCEFFNFDRFLLHAVQLSRPTSFFDKIVYGRLQQREAEVVACRPGKYVISGGNDDGCFGSRYRSGVVRVNHRERAERSDGC